jgi:hypothetical protein
MTGKHRTPDSRNSVRLLSDGLSTFIVGGVVPLGFLALVGYGIYLIVAKPTADLLSLVIAMQSMLCIWLAGDLAWTLLRKSSILARQILLPRVCSEACQLAFWTAGLLITIDYQQGWAKHSPASYVLLGFETAFMLASWAFRRVLKRRQNDLPEPGQPHD